MARCMTSTRCRNWNRARIHHIEAVVDRVIIREGIRTRVGESVDLAMRFSAMALYWPVIWTRATPRSVARRAVQHAACLPGLRNQLFGTGASHLQLQ